MRGLSRPAGGKGENVTRLEAFRRLTVAEELFEFLGVRYDPRVLTAYRLHVLRRFGLEMDLIDRQHPSLEEEARLALYREALVRAHELFQRSTPREQKLFRAVGGAEPLVPLPRRSSASKPRAGCRSTEHDRPHGQRAEVEAGDGEADGVVRVARANRVE